MDDLNIQSAEWDRFLSWDGTTSTVINQTKDEFDDFELTPDMRWLEGSSAQPSDELSGQTCVDSLIEDAPFDLDEDLISPSSEGFPFGITARSAPQLSRIHGQPTRIFQRPDHTYSTLSPTEIRELQNIAMPHRAQLPAQPVPTESVEEKKIACSPESAPKRKARNNKRKSMETCGTGSEGLLQSRKRGHNAIEKRYRTNLNDRIMNLKESIPPPLNPDDLDTPAVDGEEVDDKEGKEGTAQKYGKAAILMRAVDYIRYLEDTTHRMGKEAVIMKSRVLAFERLAMSDSVEMATAKVDQGTLIAETLQSIQSGEIFESVSYFAPVL